MTGESPTANQRTAFIRTDQSEDAIMYVLLYGPILRDELDTSLTGDNGDKTIILWVYNIWNLLNKTLVLQIFQPLMNGQKPTEEGGGGEMERG